MSELADTVLVTDQNMLTLIEESSLGTTGARRLRQRVAPQTADRVVASAEAASTPDDQAGPSLESVRNDVVHDRRPAMSITTELHDLVADAQTGDHEAIAALFAKIEPMVQRYCRARIGRSGSSYSSADDVTQEICLGVLGALKKFDDQPSAFVPFVYGIAAHKVADHYRKVGRDRVDLDAEVPDHVDPRPNPEQATLDGEERIRLAQIMESLPKKQREVLHLRLIIGLSAQEVAQSLGLTASAVRVVQHRALNTLRRRFARAL